MNDDSTVEHGDDCTWRRTTSAECEYRDTHNYCPHPEHACSCPPSSAAQHNGDKWRHVKIKAGNPRVVAIEFETAEKATEFISRFAAAPLLALVDQTWCDHCSADLNGVKHILCERCYREYAGPKWFDAATKTVD